MDLPKPVSENHKTYLLQTVVDTKEHIYLSFFTLELTKMGLMMSDLCMFLPHYLDFLLKI